MSDRKQKTRRSGGDHGKTKQMTAVLRGTASEFGDLEFMPRKSIVQQKKTDGGGGVRDFKKSKMELKITGPPKEVVRLFHGLREIKRRKMPTLSSSSSTGDQRTATSSGRGSSIRGLTKSQDNGTTSSARDYSRSRSSRQTYSTIHEYPPSSKDARRTRSNLSVSSSASSYGSYRTSSSSDYSTFLATYPSNSKVESRTAAIKSTRHRQACGVGAVVLCGLVRAAVLLCGVLSCC